MVIITTHYPVSLFQYICDLFTILDRFNVPTLRLLFGVCLVDYPFRSNQSWSQRHKQRIRIISLFSWLTFWRMFAPDRASMAIMWRMCYHHPSRRRRERVFSAIINQITNINWQFTERFIAANLTGTLLFVFWGNRTLLLMQRNMIPMQAFFLYPT